MLDPLSRKLASVHINDEPFTEEDRKAVSEADQWIEHNALIPIQDVLSDVGLTLDDWDAMRNG